MAQSQKTKGRTKVGTATAAARSTGAKQPGDYQTASNDVEPDIVEFEFEGVIYEIETDKLDDLETMELLGRSLSQGLTALLGVDQYKGLVKNLKENDDKGILRISKTREFFEKMQEAVGPLV